MCFLYINDGHPCVTVWVLGSGGTFFGRKLLSSCGYQALGHFYTSVVQGVFRAGLV